MKGITYLIILALLFVAELVYFRIADRFNIIDKPNQRSSHTKIVLRGGGVIFTIALWIWSVVFGFPYPWLLAGVTLAAGISFIDDIHSLPDSLRLVVQFASMFLIFHCCYSDYGRSNCSQQPVLLLFLLHIHSFHIPRYMR